VPLWIGTSGWQYRHWRGQLYDGLPQAKWFDAYVEAFSTVELNVTFYRQPKPAVFEAWARRVPADFVFSVKASRFLTHIKRLNDPKESVEFLLEGASRLGPHLGPILLQLPPDMAAEPERLDDTLAAFPKDLRITFEPRNRTWFEPEVIEILERRGAALCWADRRRPLTPEIATAEWGYVRFHGGRSMPRGCYREDALAAWIERIRLAWPADRDVYAYFNNDFHGCAPRDAGMFSNLARAAGLDPTRAPDPASLPVG